MPDLRAVDQSLTAAYVVDNDSYFVTLLDPRTLYPGIVGSDDLFPIPKFTPLTLGPGRHVDADAFQSPSVGMPVRPGLVIDADTILSVRAGASIAPPLYAPGDIIYTPVKLTPLSLGPARFIDIDAFYSPALDPQSVMVRNVFVDDAEAIPGPTLSYLGSFYPINCMWCGRIGLPLGRANLLAQVGLFSCDDHKRTDAWVNWPHTKPPFDIGYPTNPTIQ